MKSSTERYPPPHTHTRPEHGCSVSDSAVSLTQFIVEWNPEFSDSLNKSLASLVFSLLPGLLKLSFGSNSFCSVVRLSSPSNTFSRSDNNTVRPNLLCLFRTGTRHVYPASVCSLSCRFDVKFERIFFIFCEIESKVTRFAEFDWMHFNIFFDKNGSNSKKRIFFFKV